MQTVTKTWQDLPAAHRQPDHDGHCRLIHGHNWRFDVTFSCDKLDENGFVVDVGRLEKVKQFLEDTFDHTLLLNDNDPILKREFAAALSRARFVLVPNCGMEGLAQYVFTQVETLLDTVAVHSRGLRVVEVVCWEDSKNRATYRP